MSWTTKAFIDRMTGDPTLVSLVASYNNRPAIFGFEDVPATVTPYIVTAGDVSNVAALYKGVTMRQIVRHIRCYDVTKNGVVKIEAIADRIADLFRSDLLGVNEELFPTISTARIINCVSYGPLLAPTDATMNGRLVQVHILAQEIR